ncbi:hypothetical protein FSP39_011921 [Pinctada imbricata]|uniref:C2H2-type domain-containing protein n=1 Tax=Pinctada imbricata TaxID=66713 RepID=A0AA88YJL8_PINIB|nr:hypothetical protein FSP39_011921 [Pinctada imbricata]
MQSTSCPVCSRNFSRSDAMRRHLRTSHQSPYSRINEPYPQISEPYPQITDAYPQISESYPHITDAYPAPPPPPPPPPKEVLPPPPPKEALPPPPPPPPKESFKFQHPFTMIVAGPTMSGKTTWVKDLLILNQVMIKPSPTRIIWLYKRWQPMYDVIKKMIHPPVHFIQGLPSNIQHNDFINPKEYNLLIMDDIQRDASGNQDVCELFTEGAHHRNLSVICLMQNIFNKGKENRTISLNSQYLVLFKNPRDQLQISVLARQMYPGKTKTILDAYNRAIEKPFGYLVVDLKQTTQESERLQTDIFRDYIRREPLEIHHLSTERQGVHTDFPSTTEIMEHRYLSHADTRKPYHLENTPNSPEMYQESPNKMDHMKPWIHRELYESMKKEHPSCSDCGIMFGTHYDLQRHIKKGCPMDEDSIEDSDENDMQHEESDNEDGFSFLVNEVWDENSAQFNRKVDQLMEDDPDMSKKEARDDASELMLNKDRSLFMKKYKNFISNMFRLNASKLHRSIKNEISNLMDDKDYDMEEAVDLVLKRHKQDFGSLFEDYEQMDDNEQSDEESDSEED